MKTFKEYNFGVLKYHPAMLPASEDDGEWVTGDPTKPIEGWEDKDVETIFDKSEKQIEKDRNTQEVTEAADSTVKGWIHPKTKKVYLTKRLRPYHVEFIVKKPRDFGISEKDILKVLEGWNDAMDAPDPRDSAEKDLVRIKKGDIDIHRLVESLAMNKGWYRVVGNMWASEIAGIKINDKIIHDVLNIMEDEGVIPYEGKDIKQLECREYQPDKNNAGYPDSKLIKLLVGDKILRALRGKKTGDKQTEIGRTMAMFREFVEMDEALNLRSLAKNTKIASAIKANKNKANEVLMLALLSIPAFANIITPDNLNRANIIGSQLKQLVIGEENERQEV